MTFDVSRVRAILFDLDGTLADTDDEYVREAARDRVHVEESEVVLVLKDLVAGDLAPDNLAEDAVGLHIRPPFLPASASRPRPHRHPCSPCAPGGRGSRIGG